MISRAAEFMSAHMVSAAVALPLAGAIVSLAIPAGARAAARVASAIFSAVGAGLCVAAFARIRGSGEIEFAEMAQWIPSLGIYYRVGFDGVSGLLAAAASASCFGSIIFSLRREVPRERLSLALMLFAQGCLTGIFASLDGFLFYLFWSGSAAALCLLTGVWGEGGRIAAATKFMAFAAAGSAAMLLAFAFAGASAESFYIVDWMAHRFGLFDQMWMFWALALAFGVMMPIAGLHTWLADLCEQSSPAGAALAGGAMLAAGAYGFFRIGMPIAPVAVAVFAPAMCWLGVAAVFMGAMLALAERDLARIAAAVSLSQMGIVLLGLFSLQSVGVSGAVLLMAANALIACGVHMVSGTLRARAGGSDLANAGGIWRAMPAVAAALALFAAAAVGLPGLAGFSGQFTLLLGSFQVRTLHASLALAGLAILASAIAVRVVIALFGRRAAGDERRRSDAGPAEITAMAAIGAVIVLAGLWPQPLLGRIERPAEAFVKLSKRVEMIIPAGRSPVPDEAAPEGRGE